MLKTLKAVVASAIAALLVSGSIAYGVVITGVSEANQSMIDRVGYLALSRTDSITAFAGGGQASATALDSGYNRVTVVATAADSVKLPLCRTGAAQSNTVGMIVIVTNADAADSMNVFPQTSDSINALAANAAYAMAANKTAAFICGTASGTAGTWYSILGA